MIKNGTCYYGKDMFRDKTMPLLKNVLLMRQNVDGAYTIFCDTLLLQVVGRNIWKAMGTEAYISKIATVSDEAFAILLLENNYDVWKEDVVGTSNGGVSGNVVPRPFAKTTSKYTLNGAGTKKNQGWTNEGVNWFNTPAALVSADRIWDASAFEKKMKKDIIS